MINKGTLQAAREAIRAERIERKREFMQAYTLARAGQISSESMLLNMGKVVRAADELYEAIEKRLNT